MKDFIDGSGISKGSRKPSVTAISGSSSDNAEVLFGLGEGQIQGTPDNQNLGAYVFLDDTPIKSGDGTQLIPNCIYIADSGALIKPNFIPNVADASETSNDVPVNVSVLNGTPITRTSTNSAINAFRVRVGVQLQKLKTNGDVTGLSFDLAIQIQEGNGPFTQRLYTTINGRFSSTTVFEYFLPVSTGLSTYNIRVIKNGQNSTVSTPGYTGDQITSELSFLSFEEVIQQRMTYPNTAALWLSFPGSLFQSVPKVSIELIGLLFNIPSNTTVGPVFGESLFNGGWDGTFYTPPYATSDPAWIVWNLLTNKRYGLGVDPNFIDRYSLYNISVYNSGAVNDGFGGVESRFTFNAVLDKSQPATELVRNICASMAVKLFWNGTQISFWQDCPTVVINKILSNADVEDGTFLYTSQEYKQISTVCKVWWKDPSNKYADTPEFVEYPAAIARYGYHLDEFTLLGCTSRGQAVRAGRRVILSSLLDNEQISCKVRAIALFSQPGEIVQILDNNRGKQRRSGLIASATTTTITLDSEIEIFSVSTTIHVSLPDLSVGSAIIANSPGTYTTINLTSALPSAPQPQSTWQIIDLSATPKKYRIISVTPDKDNPNFYEVVGKLYNLSKYSEIENGWALNHFIDPNLPPTIVPLPQNVSAQKIEINDGFIVDWDSNSSNNFSLEATWTKPLKIDGVTPESYISGYYAEYKRDDGEWGHRNQITTLSCRWENAGSGNFYVRVCAVCNANQKVSQWAESGSSATLSIVNISTAAYFIILVMDDLG